MKKTIKTILKFSVFGTYELVRDKKLLRQRNQQQKKLLDDYVANNRVKKLQIGSGSNIFKGWLNTDLNQTEKIAFLDAGKPFPIESNSFDYIYSEHVFEHLTLEQQLNMLREGKRVLKDDGIMRIATPSLDFLFNLYQNPTRSDSNEYVEWAVNRSPYLSLVKSSIEDSSQHYCYVINNFFRAWGHQLIHNYTSLSKLALEVGYKDTRPCQVSASEVPDLRNIEKHGTIIPPEMNLLETMVIEMIK